MIGLSQAVTPPSAVSVVSDAAADVGSALASNWIAAHPEWGGAIAIALVFAASGIAYLRRQARKTETVVDDVVLDVAAKVVEQTADSLDKDKAGK